MVIVVLKTSDKEDDLKSSRRGRKINHVQKNEDEMPAGKSSGVLRWSNISKVLNTKTKADLEFRGKNLLKMKVKQKLFQTYKS